uniref:Zinc finger protein 653-like n=1 Tax=Sinocyclocheilus anshuiensis TaxID=1608454 RepID=A0A671RZR7_9TELE
MEKDEEDRPPEKKSTVSESINTKNAISDLEDNDHPSHVEHQMTCTSLSDLPGSPAAHSSPPTSERCPWEMEVLMDRVAQAALVESDGKALSEDAARETDPVREQTDASGTLEKADSGGGLTESYECVLVTAPLTDRQEREDGANCPREGGVEGIPSLAAAPAQNQLFESQDLQTVMGGCELPDQRSTLEGSQLIIITGPSYEALASEGIQLNVAGSDVEEVTCTLIGDVSYNQMCQSRPSADLAEKQLLDPGEETHCSKELQQSLSRCKRSRRGPVIEADGMLKMFHCPYEGCSQVYVAISSFQNHVNLVHRKGRTKVCPHPGCGKKFYLSNHLHRHMIIHSGVRDFICETCGKSFKRKNHLEVHR